MNLLSKTQLVFILCLTLTSTLCSASIEILEPSRSNWVKEQAHIDEAIFNVTPKRFYSEVELTLTVSARNTQFEGIPSDFLEIEQFFELPEGAILHEAWLWFHGEVLRAEIYEKNQAIEIYESFVERNTDPLVVFKTGDKYEARVFPMTNTGSRKYRFHFLIPHKKQLGSTYMQIPLNMVAESQGVQTSENIQINIANSEYWETPQEVEGATSFSYSPAGLASVFKNTSVALRQNSSFLLTKKNNVPSAQLYENNGEYFFHGELETPSSVDTVNYFKDIDKVLFVLSVYSRDEQFDKKFSEISEAIEKAELDGYKVNLVYEYFDRSNLLYPDWKTWDKVAFKASLDSLQRSYYNVSYQITGVMNFVNSMDLEDGIAVLFTDNANIYRQYETIIKANAYEFKYYTLYEENTTLPAENSWWSDAQSAKVQKEGNRHFMEFSRFTQSIGQATYDDFISQLSQSFIKETYLPVISTKVDAGDEWIFYDHISSNQILSGVLREPIDSITVRVLYEDFSESSQVLNFEGVEDTDTTLKEFWAGTYLNSNHTISSEQATGLSLKYEVLTDLTAFLALEDVEPSTVISRDDQWEIIGVQETVSEGSLLLYPNPASSQLTLEFLGSIHFDTQSTISITSNDGKEVYRVAIQDSDVIGDGKLNLSETVKFLNSGIYFIQWINGNQNTRLKFIKI